MTTNEPNETETSLPSPGVQGDSPIRVPEHDAFGIDPFAQAIAQSIRAADTRDGIVYAVNGIWGSGKSSAINLVLHHLTAAIEAGELSITAFNPWWFSGAEALTISFFQELRAAIGKSVDDQTRETLASIGSRLSSAGPLLGGIASLFGTPAAGAALSGGITLLEKLTQLDSTVEGEHRKLFEALGKQTKKFLIVLDDIDRLTTDDALQIFKLVKSVGRLPNVIYLMAFDRQLAERMVAERFPAEGGSYLEKVIQGAFDLPVPDPLDLQQQLLTTAQAVMGAPSSGKMNRFWNLFHDGVAPLIKTPRDTVRLSNAIKVSWPAIREEVDRADFLTIEAMRLFLPSTYEAVRAHPEMLTGTQPDYGYDKRGREVEYTDTFLNPLEGRDRDIAKRALRRLFPRLDSIWSNVGRSESSQWQRDRLICSREHFSTYFAFSVTNQGITVSEIDAMIANAGVPGATANALANFLAMPRKRGGTRAALALDELSVHAEDIAADDIQQFVEDLFSVADELDVAADRDRGFTGMASNDLRLHWLLNNLLRDRLDLATRSNIIRGAAPASSIGWLLTLSDRCKSKKDKRAASGENEPEKLTDDDTTDWLYAHSLERIRAAASDGTLKAVPNLVVLLIQWNARAGEEEVRSWTNSQFSDAAFVVRLAEHLVQETWSAGMGGFGFLGDTVASKKEYVRLEPLKLFLDVARFRERVTELLQLAETDPADRAVLERFQSAPERSSQRPDD